ncbi:hypothetical protein [Granulosicoccus antarcticus]|uniref:Uncharacterized protein n=1 Tax=Granulosicoccus antarcticus IMCC3135 TaxID=1192854 RepID=A0A2Z2NSA2_9GAMM|nr:hypothetical protein [Granulosicoccus antarcticus]ASJ74426.1 hypothetical protein IMCC3135_21750 [Granulosicoccus antarcticus IMCC3135]
MNHRDLNSLKSNLQRNLAMKSIFHSIYGSEILEMAFDVPTDLAISRLKAKVRRFGFFHGGSPKIVGFVGVNSVKLERSAAFVTNSFRPVFVGHFETEINTTKLSGVFRLNRFVQVFMTFWLVFALVIFGIMVVVVVQETGEAGFMSLIQSLLLIACPFGVMKLGKWIAANDREWLKKTISNAINNET